jgi:hypothetical protein
MDKIAHDVKLLVDNDKEMTDISCLSYDIAFYAINKYEDDIRLFRLYIEEKVRQYINNLEIGKYIEKK